jgi:hypothetical protein
MTASATCRPEADTLLGLLRDLTDVSLRLARRVGERALVVWGAAEASAEPAGKTADPALLFARLTGVARHFIALELRLGALGKPSTPKPAAPPPAPSPDTMSPAASAQKTQPTQGSRRQHLQDLAPIVPLTPFAKPPPTPIMQARSAPRVDVSEPSHLSNAN